jgi:hypothetical protein
MRQVRESRSWIWLVVALVAILGLAAAGCNELKTVDTGASVVTPATGVTTTEAGVTTTVGSVPTTTLTPASTPTTVALASSESLLSNGHIKACGIIKEVSVTGGVRHLKIDYVDFLTGAAADAAAVAAGEISPGEHVDDDYFVSNVNPKLRTFDVSNSVVITTYSVEIPLDVADAPFPWSECMVMWGGASGVLTDAEVSLKDGLWWIERDGNTIVKIDEQWVP